MRFALTLALLAACGGAAPPAEPPKPEPVEAPAPPPPPAPPAEAAPTVGVEVTTLKKGTIEDKHTMDVDVSALTVATPFDPSTLAGALTIKTDTWRSGVEIRDGRVKDLFLKVAEQPTASVQVESVTGLGPLAPGARGEGVVKGTLKVLAGSLPIEAKVAVTRTDAGLEFSTLAPVEVTASALGLSEGHKAVAEACGVEVSEAVKVNARFTVPQG